MTDFVVVAEMYMRIAILQVSLMFLNVQSLGVCLYAVGIGTDFLGSAFLNEPDCFALPRLIHRFEDHYSSVSPLLRIL